LSEFPADVYKIVDPWESSYQEGMAWPHKGTHVQQTQTELCPGDKICNTSKMKRVMFSGSVVKHKLGITVAHAFGRGNRFIKVECERDMATPHIGSCRKCFRGLVQAGGREFTADLALLDLDTRSCSVSNTVWWPKRGYGRTLQIKIYKGPEIAKDNGVMILDQNGEFHYGCVRRTSLSDGGLQGMLGICASEQQEVEITKLGDSGALVMSFPNNENDTVYVYGISTGIYKTPDGKTTMTIANSLWKVIQGISSALQVHNSPQNIDFA